MEIIEVPEVIQLPELSGGNEILVPSPIWSSQVFCDVIVPSFYADYEWNDSPHSPVSWRMHPQVTDIVSREFEAGLSPSLSSFRASLNYIGERYLREASRHGCAERLLRQSNITRRCLLFLAGTGKVGHWIRAYVFPG
jgi:hypothetical protein